MTSVEKTSERNQFDDTNPKNVVKISYKVENNSGAEYFVDSDIDVYDSKGTMGERYPLDNTTGKIPDGKNMNADFHAGVNESGNIEIIFNLFSDANLTFHAKI
ncbi:gp32 [Listeria innocua FSL S4-378]|nr:gp32 [Listeria innocua FSL S4-378]